MKFIKLIVYSVFGRSLMWMCVSMSQLTALRSSPVITKSSIMERQGNVLWILRWHKKVSSLVFHSRL